MNSAILAPAAILVVWTLIMMIWVMVTRFPAMKKLNIDLGAVPGGRGQNLEGVVPDKVNWKAHNYNHLMEQPTIFYATVFIIALTGTGDVWLNVWLAWAYVGLRIVHSLIQATWNYVPARFVVFMLGSFALLALAIHAAAAAFH